MIRRFLLLVLFTLFCTQGYAQISNSVLSKGDWYKFSVDTTGVFRIDRALLQKMGINTSNIDPRNIRIYGNGGAMLAQRNDHFR
ncbi:MAG: hypothetical protein JKZ00_00285, partial [Flavobacteriaceae bacterium]|nr:hypothetical protein [Flavobacteriaceae bacterium]